MPTHPYELFLVPADIEHANPGPAQDSVHVASWQPYRILCQELFALEFRWRFRHSFSTLQWEVDLLLKAYNRERVARGGSKPGRTPLGLLLERSGPSKQQDSGRESTLSTASL